ncbi:MAG: tRNA (adenosine(37)-N6)-dimethylallyltransferase MiaA, partial [Deltaproteobacteria bacterium]
MNGVQSSPEKPGVVVICGPTASGKTAVCQQLAGHFSLEVVSADSRQIYRHMDIGTAKPTASERACVRHHLVDIVDPDEDFTVAHFVESGRRIVADILSRGKLPVIAGGTGLYIQGLTAGLADVPGPDPDFRQRMHRLAANHDEGWLHRQLQQVDPVLAEKTD